MDLQIETHCPTTWKFDYESSTPELDNLYELAKRDQWNVSVDIDWDLGAREDNDVFARKETSIAQTEFFGKLNKTMQKDLLANLAGFTLSQFLHGEQGALLCCGQLVDSVPTVEGKLYAATQVMDEARHVEVFHRYLNKLDKKYPVSTALKKVLDAILAADTWQAKSVGMNILVESLAMGTFYNMMIQAEDPLLASIVKLTAQDEARHVNFGIISLMKEIPTMAEDDRAALEDFALGAIGILLGQGDEPGFDQSKPFLDAGVDPDDLKNILAPQLQEADVALMQSGTKQRSVVHEYMVPNLGKIGLISDRIRPKYVEAGLIQ
jgi:hypothetical protein